MRGIWPFVEQPRGEEANLKDAKAVKAKMDKKLKKVKKKHFKKTIKMTVFTILLSASAGAVLLYNRLSFKGEVKDKYQSDNSSEMSRNHIVVKTWFGEKDFCVDDETYESVEVGAAYPFKKDTDIDWVKLNEEQSSEQVQ